MPDESNGNMQACGCPKGRPCTCEMGKKADSEDALAYACGECLHCRLNARKNRKELRKCLKYDEYMLELRYEKIQLHSGCAFRLLKPTWNTDEKSQFFNRMHQLRLGWVQTQQEKLALLDEQRKLRRKLNQDYVYAQEMVKKMDDIKKNGGLSKRAMKEALQIDSDVFDSSTKQLVPAERLLPDLRSRLELTNTTIATEERNLKIIREYVFEFAAFRVQGTIRDFLRQQRWKQLWRTFREDAEFAAAVVIQSVYRMYRGKLELHFMRRVQENRKRKVAAGKLRRLFVRIHILRLMRTEKMKLEAEEKAQLRKSQATDRLKFIWGRISVRRAFAKLKEMHRAATVQEQRRHMSAIVLIQRMYRGFRDRLFLRRLRLRCSLTPRLRDLMEHFLIHGDLWGFLLHIDADYRRFMHQQADEESSASTYLHAVVKSKHDEENRMMHGWLKATALRSPSVRGMKDMKQQYSDSNGSQLSSITVDSLPSSLDSDMSEALLDSSLYKDIKDMSASDSPLFPESLPATVIRSMMAEGFDLEEIIPVMRGLRAEKKDVNNTTSVKKMLQARTPLMRNPWKSERKVRAAMKKSNRDGNALVRRQSPDHGKSEQPATKPAPKLRSRPPMLLPTTTNTFVTADLIHTIPGGMNGAISRLALVAGLRCFDPEADGGDGAFVAAEDFVADPFESYLALPSGLLKIRREQAVTEAVRPHVQKLISKKCFIAYDLLSNVRGIQQLVSWDIPAILAHSIYDVITDLHKQCIHASRQNVRQQLYISPAFADFMARRLQESKSSRLLEPLPQSKTNSEESASSTVDPNLTEQTKQQLSRDVLGLPLTTVDIPVSELLFKSAFIVCDDSDDTTTGADDSMDPLNFDLFVERMVGLQEREDHDAQRSIVQERVRQAFRVVHRFESHFQISGIHSARDLLLTPSLALQNLPDVLATQMQNLLAPLKSRRRSSLSMNQIPTGSVINPTTPGSVLAEASPIATRKASKSSKGNKITSPKQVVLSPLLMRAQATMENLQEDLIKLKLPTQFE